MHMVMIHNNQGPDKTEVRVRFAPSPTGEPHIGNARIAEYNYLFAKQHGGKFFLRLEDTDRERSKQEYEDSIRDMLFWLEMKPEKEIWKQSQRTEAYESFFKKLVNNNKIYYCQCKNIEIESSTEEGLKNKCNCENQKFHNGAARFKVEKNRILELNDLILGKVVINTNTLEDFVIKRSDGGFTYNFAVVVDDIEMKISHVLRGNDHLYNTFKQILIYEALLADLPIFGHISMVGGEDGAKLSKRLGTGNILNYKNDLGIVSDAMFTYLATLSGGFGDNEPRTREEIIKLFDIKKISKSQCAFNEDKLLSLSGEYLTNDPKKYFSDVFVYLHKENGKNTSISHFLRLKELLPEFAKRNNTLLKLAKSLNFVYNDLIIDDELMKQLNKEILLNVIEILENINDYDAEMSTDLFQISANDWNEENLHKIFKETFPNNLSEVCNNLRISILNTTFSPSIFLVIGHLGKKDTIRKLKLAIEKL